MIWLKSRSHTNPWMVYHKGLDGGTNPSHKYLQLNDTAAESDADVIWNDTAPTAVNFTLGSHSYVNTDAYTYIAMLFASVDGVSKVGSFSGSNSDLSVNVGFQPRFLIIKGATGSNATYNWFVFDSVRGFGAGVDNKIYLNSSGAQSNSYNQGTFTSTGFTLPGNTNQNVSGTSFIYYAHA